MAFFRDWMAQGRSQAPQALGVLNSPEMQSPFWQYLLECTDPLSMIVGAKRAEGMSHRIMVGGAAGELKLTAPDTSVLVLGPPRSTGKTAGVIVPAILTARGPVVSVSTKPDVFVATSLHRRRQGQVWSFCPDGSPPLPGTRQLRWSPIGGDWGACLNRSTWMVQAANMSKDARTNSNFWESRASDLLAVMLFYAGQRGRSMEWLVQAIAAMRLQDDFLPIVEDLGSMGHSMPSGILRGIIMGGDRTRADIFATASVVLRPFLLPAALEMTKDPNFDLVQFVAGLPDTKSQLIEEHPINADSVVDGKFVEKPWDDWIKQDGAYYTVYISTSEENMSLVAPLIVGFLGDIKRQVYAQHRADELAGVPRRPPVLWAIDELASCPIPDLAVTLRDSGSSGLLILGALQSLTQTAKWGDEGKALQTLFNNVMVLPGIRDRETLELLSMLVGEFDREVWGGSWSRGAHNGREWQASQSWQRMPRLAPDDIYRGNPHDPDAALVFAKNGWQWITVQLFFRTGIWPVLLLTSCEFAKRHPDIAVQGLPFPDLARGNNFTYLQRISPQFANRFAKVRENYLWNIAQWHEVLAVAHAEATHEDELRSIA